MLTCHGKHILRLLLVPEYNLLVIQKMSKIGYTLQLVLYALELNLKRRTSNSADLPCVWSRGGATANLHHLPGLNNGSVFSHSSGDQKPTVRCAWQGAPLWKRYGRILASSSLGDCLRSLAFLSRRLRPCRLRPRRHTAVGSLCVCTSKSPLLTRTPVTGLEPRPIQ